MLDVEMARLDTQLRLVRQLINDAADALLTFYSPHLGAFRRDSNQWHRLGRRDVGRSSTNRAFFALLEYLRFLHEDGSDQESEKEKRERASRIHRTRQILRGVARGYLADLKFARATGQDEMNMYTDSHLLMTLALVPRLGEVVGGRLENRLISRARAAVSRYLTSTRVACGIGMAAASSPRTRFTI